MGLNLPMLANNGEASLFIDTVIDSTVKMSIGNTVGSRLSLSAQFDPVTTLSPSDKMVDYILHK
jgi:hypothetical protein